MLVTRDLADADQSDANRVHRYSSPRFSLWKRRSKTPYRRVRRRHGLQSIAQRQRERRRLDLEDVAVARLDAVGERQRRRAEEMHMQVARPAEQRVFEEIGRAH